MGDLPDSPPFKYLRPFAVQAEVGYAGRVQGPANFVPKLSRLPLVVSWYDQNRTRNFRLRRPDRGANLWSSPTTIQASW
jgi:hypothetical protein